MLKSFEEPDITRQLFFHEVTLWYEDSVLYQ